MGRSWETKLIQPWREWHPSIHSCYTLYLAATNCLTTTDSLTRHLSLVQLWKPAKQYLAQGNTQGMRRGLEKGKGVVKRTWNDYAVLQRRTWAARERTLGKNPSECMGKPDTAVAMLPDEAVTSLIYKCCLLAMIQPSAGGAPVYVHLPLNI